MKFNTFFVLALAGVVFARDATVLTDYENGDDNGLLPPQTEAIRILSNHKVVYSDPPVNTKYLSRSQFNPRGMQHVYTITHAFLDLIQREDVFPPGLNASVLLDTPNEKIPEVLEEHWEEILLQYIGIATAAICGLLLALAMPVACFCLCCCRCAGKCGAYPEHFDKKSDACKRFMTGCILAVLVVIAMFGVVCAFVTNFYCYDGMQKLPERLQRSSDDTSQYLGNTGKEINSLLVTNFGELELVLRGVLDESGPILKKSLAEVTQAAAIDDLTDIVSNLGSVKRYLKEIQNKTHVLQDKVGQLALGLNGTSFRLLQALKQCTDNPVCADFLGEYNIGRDLAIAASFSDLPTKLPDLSLLMKDISDLMNNDIERKVRGGQKQLDKVKVDIEKSIGDIRPKIKDEIRRMGKQLEEQADNIRRLLGEVDGHVTTINGEIPKVKPIVDEYGYYLFYIGLGMSILVLLILVCYIFGLFYGFCGKRPGNVYGDDCCNTGTGANWLLAAVYLTFLFSCVLLVIATAQFLVGSTADKVVCEAFKNPNGSEVFQLVDQRILQPMLRQQQQRQLSVAAASSSSSGGGDVSGLSSMSFSELIGNCHRNLTLYQILKIENIYDIEELKNWRKQYGIGDFIDNLKRKIRLDDLRAITILSPEAERELQDLAESQISDLNFSEYTRLLDEKITAIDLNVFTAKLRQVRERLSRTQARLVGPAIDNEALFLDQMLRVVMDMKLAMRDLDNSVRAMEQEAKHAKPNLREALRELIKQATKATTFLREEGPQLVDSLTDQYVNETVGLIDEYVERVINHTMTKVGRCEPLSASYNATIIAVCNEIADPFNGFWASIGWCLMFFLPSIALSLSLVALYRKSEAYPGPLVETVPASSALVAGSGEESQHAKKKRRGHRRNPSEYLPDSAHYRAGYSYQDRDQRFQDMAPRSYGDNPGTSGVTAAAVQAPVASSSSAVPPRYSSNPSLDTPSALAAGGPAEYERPPPYYFPGTGPILEAPPALPAPNRP